MKYYAQLNENNICVGVSQLSGEVEQDNMIEISEPNFEFYVWKKYENGEWTNEKYEPISTAPLTEFEKLKQNLELMQIAVDELILGGGM